MSFHLVVVRFLRRLDYWRLPAAMDNVTLRPKKLQFAVVQYNRGVIWEYVIFWFESHSSSNGEALVSYFPFSEQTQPWLISFHCILSTLRIINGTLSMCCIVTKKHFGGATRKVIADLCAKKSGGEFNKKRGKRRKQNCRTETQQYEGIHTSYNTHLVEWYKSTRYFAAKAVFGVYNRDSGDAIFSYTSMK